MVASKPGAQTMAEAATREKTQDYFDVVGRMCARDQRHSAHIAVLLILLVIQGVLLYRAVGSTTVHAYQIDTTGKSQYMGTMDLINQAYPSSKEVEFVALKFVSLLYDRNSSKAESNINQAMMMCAHGLQKKTQAQWLSREAVRKIQSEQVRTEIIYQPPFVELIKPGLWNVRVRGEQRFFPWNVYDGEPWSTRKFHVGLSLSQIERDPINFPNGLQIEVYETLSTVHVTSDEERN